MNVNVEHSNPSPLGTQSWQHRRRNLVRHQDACGSQDYLNGHIPTGLYVAAKPGTIMGPTWVALLKEQYNSINCLFPYRLGGLTRILLSVCERLGLCRGGFTPRNSDL